MNVVTNVCFYLYAFASIFRAIKLKGYYNIHKMAIEFSDKIPESEILEYKISYSPYVWCSIFLGFFMFDAKILDLQTFIIRFIPAVFIGLFAARSLKIENDIETLALNSGENTEV